MAPPQPEARAGAPRSGRRQRREQRRRARDIRRVTLATVFVALEISGFWVANFADRDSWTELTGYLLLQPVQILLNTLDGRFQFTRGMRDSDAMLLITMLSLPLNVLFWYGVWRAWRKLRRTLRRRRRAVGAAFGPAPLPTSRGQGSLPRALPVAPLTAPSQAVASEHSVPAETTLRE